MESHWRRYGFGDVGRFLSALLPNLNPGVINCREADQVRRFHLMLGPAQILSLTPSESHIIPWSYQLLLIHPGYPDTHTNRWHSQFRGIPLWCFQCPTTHSNPRISCCSDSGRFGSQTCHLVISSKNRVRGLLSVILLLRTQAEMGCSLTRKLTILIRYLF